MHASRTWLVRSIAAAAVAVTCLAASVPPAVADGFRHGGFFGGFRGPFGCFHCGGFAFRGGFFGFGPGWGVPYGYPYAYPYPYPYPYPYRYPYAYPYAGGYPVPPPAIGASPAPEAGAPSGQSCNAGAYVCPMERPVPSGSACYCLSNNRTPIPGHAD
jgi:hypothetical protein